MNETTPKFAISFLDNIFKETTTVQWEFGLQTTGKKKQKNSIFNFENQLQQFCIHQFRFHSLSKQYPEQTTSVSVGAWAAANPANPGSHMFDSILRTFRQCDKNSLFIFTIIIADGGPTSAKIAISTFMFCYFLVLLLVVKKKQDNRDFHHKWIRFSFTATTNDRTLLANVGKFILIPPRAYNISLSIFLLDQTRWQLGYFQSIRKPNWHSARSIVQFFMSLFDNSPFNSSAVLP